MSKKRKKLAAKYLVRRVAVGAVLAALLLGLLALGGCALGRLLGPDEPGESSPSSSEPLEPPEPSSAQPASQPPADIGAVQSGGEADPSESLSQPQSEAESQPEPEPEPEPESQPEPQPEPAAQKVMKPADLTVDWKLLLINPTHYIEEELDIQLASVDGTYSMDSRVVGKVKELIAAAREDGVYLTLTSAYRTMDRSRTLYNNKVAQYLSMGYGQSAAQVEAAKWVAPPGTSEHHSGLAMDIISIDYYTKYNDLVEEFEKDAEAVWLKNNCHRFGFILRYPADKTDITGINYEPWHYRYVGEKAAKEIMEKGLCLEEYLGILD